MANPRIDDETKISRGTIRKDRMEPPESERDAGEIKPRCPVYFEQYARKCWRKHIDFLWDSKWITRNSTAAFIELCLLYQEKYELAEIVETEGRFQTTHNMYGSKQINHPAYTAFLRVSKDLLSAMETIGLTPGAEDKYKIKGGNKKDEKAADVGLGSFGKPRLVKGK